MKKLPIYAMALLIAVLIGSVIPTEAEAKIYEDTLRLHILAASDSEEDQELKLKVRDLILEEYGGRLRDADSRDEAEALCEGLKEEIGKRCEEFISEHGYEYGVEVTLTVEWYDTRDYGDFSLPAGYYTSMRVIIGGGEGKNWWCVMYPPLCTDIATESSPADDSVIDYSDDEIRLIEGGERQVKFKILEFLSGLFS